MDTDHTDWEKRMHRAKTATGATEQRKMRQRMIRRFRSETQIFSKPNSANICAICGLYSLSVASVAFVARGICLTHLEKLAPTMSKDQIILVNLSGRGDKDLGTLMDVFNG